jgi:MSHA biogenesis protein MshQ
MNVHFMGSTRHYRWALLLPLLLLADMAFAATYTFRSNNATPSGGGASICSGSWSLSGSVFTCSGTLTLDAGDVLRVRTSASESLTDITIVASNSINLSGNTIGTAAKNISLQTSFGDITATGSNSIEGAVTTASGSINLAGTAVSGSVTGSGTATLTGGSVGGNVSIAGNITTNGTSITGNVASNYGTISLTAGSVGGAVSSGGSISTNGTLVSGSLTSNSGTVNLSGGSVGGVVRSGCCNVTTNGTDLLAGARSDSSGLSITGGTIAGDFVAANNPATFSGVTMTSGSVSGASTVTFTDSTVGDAQNSVTVTSTSGAVTLNNSTVYGDLTAPSYSTIFVNSPSTVIGTCVPNSTPANACSPANGAVTEILSWSLDESAWTGAANEVVDASGNDLNGTVFNGADTADSAPALPAQNSLGTCAYGSFSSAASQYVQRAHNNLLTLQDSFTIGLWIKPNTLPASGLMSILSKDENYEFHLKPNGRVNWWWQTTGPNATREFDSTVALTPGQWSHVLIRFAPNDQRIYINGNLAGQASFSGTPLANNDPLQLGADQNLAGRYFNGQLDELRIYSGALSTAAISALVAERHQCGLALQCFNDDFGRTGLGSDWAVASRGATAFTPAIASARMRLTSNQGNVATSSTLQRLFPAAGNYIQVQFKHYAYNGSGADGIAVVLSDASVTPQPGAFGGPLGYGTRGDAANPGFAGGWLGVGIDEYGNFSTEGGSPNDGPGRRTDSVAMRGSGTNSTGYRYIAGTPAGLNPGIDNAGSTSANPGHTYRITMDGRVDGQALVTVERDSGAGFVVLPNLDAVNALAAFGQAALPVNFFLSLTGSTGGSTNIHELDDLQVCATTINPIGQQVHHFEFVYTTPALTCNPHPITVRACRNADCSLLYTDTVSVELAPSSGWNATGSATITNGNILEFEGGVASLRLGHSVAEVVTVGALDSTPPKAPNSQTICSTSNCQITYADSGFLIDVPNTLAAKRTPASIAAVSKPANVNVCVPTFQNVDRTISFTSAYTNPVTGARDVLVSDDDSPETATPASIALSFDATGRAPFFVRYEDAGLITLSASYTGSEGTGDAGVALVGSDTFVSKPYGLLLQTDTSSSCTDPDTTCPVFPDGVRAGDPFDLRISAVAWQRDGEALTAAELADNLVTPNFQMGDIGLTSLVVGPSGGINGDVTPGNYAHVLGAVTTVATAISEVGVFNLIATPTADYIEEDEVVSGGTSGLVGRFIPAYLNASGNASLTGSCGIFSYQGQPMDFAISREPLLTVSGHNRQGAVTQNYDRGDFWRLAAPGVGDYSSTTGLIVDARLVTQGTASLSVEGADDGDGVRGYRWSGEQLLYTPAALPSADDVPFMAAISQSFSAASLTDADGACYGAGAACQDFTYPFTDDPGSEVRLGRLRIGNAHGSELQALNLPLTVESWQATAMGNSFAPEGLDNCTAALLGAPVLDAFTGSLAAGETTPSLSGPTAGSGLVGLTAPGVGNDGSVRVSFLPALPPTWLYYDWTGNGREMDSGLATFGIYRGATPLIFRRELYR